MFLDLFYGLRKEGVPVSLQEWQGLLDAMQKGLHGSSLERFYHLGRTCLIKTETQFDAYDRVFLKVFRGIEGSLEGITDEVLKRMDEYYRKNKTSKGVVPTRNENSRKAAVNDGD